MNKSKTNAMLDINAQRNVINIKGEILENDECNCMEQELKASQDHKSKIKHASA